MLTLKEAVQFEELLGHCFQDVFIDGSQKDGTLKVIAKKYNGGGMEHNFGLRESQDWCGNRQATKGKILEFQERNKK